MKVEFNKKNDNPFEGMRYTLNLLQNATNSICEADIDRAYKEATSKEKKELFYSILFAIGDITNREHNIFKHKKTDGGGFSNREAFEVVFNWIYSHNKNQFSRFLESGLFNEYTCFDVLFKNRVQTQKGTSKVIKYTSCYEDKEYASILLNYVYKVINGTNPFNKMLVAKFLTIPRLSKRQNHKKMLPETIRVMKAKSDFLAELSSMMGWDVRFFKGYREWRRGYNGDLESVLFSTGRINEFTKDEFIDWYDKIPAQARFRVKNRILYSTITSEGETQYKWDKFRPWIYEWERFKEDKQKEQRVLEEKVRQGQATDEDKKKLEKVKKEAKVTVGANNFESLFKDICHNKIDELKLQSFINKVNLPYNSLVLIDDSGSMNGVPFEFACFIATVCLYKNPDDDARNLIGMFSDKGQWYSYISAKSSSRNQILRKEVAATKKTPFIDPTLSFYENYKRVRSFLNAVFEGGWTDLRTILDSLIEIKKYHPELIDVLKEYPVWTIVSDGELNSSHSPAASLEQFFVKAEEMLGFRPYLILIDIDHNLMSGRFKADKFAGIENVMYIPSNPAMIEQVLTNFKDMEIFDVYTPLLSLYRSNRYTLVRQNVLEG